MIHYLLLLQFPLVFCVTTMLGLVVYGSDFEDPFNGLYLLPLLIMPALQRVLLNHAPWLSDKKPGLIILSGLVLTALLASRELHFSWWDEHSAAQAVLIAAVGVLSCLASLIAATRLTTWQGNHQASVSGALLLLGLSWLPAFYYPMTSLLVISLIAMFAAVWSTFGVGEKMPAPGKPATVISYLLFVLMVDASLLIWDYQVDASWAWHLALVFAVAAPGSQLVFRMRQSASVLLMTVIITVIASLNFLVAVFWPAFVINPVHSVIVGLGVGAVIGLLLRCGDGCQPVALIRLAVPVVAGMMIGYLFYANLVFAVWRWVFLLPMLVMVPLSVRSSRKRIKK